LLSGEPFDRFHAWIDMLILANHHRCSKFIRGNEITVERGEIAVCERELAEAWSWSRTKVRRFMKMLEKRQQIVIKKSNLINRIVIVNYEKYQTGDTTEHTTEKPQKNHRKTTDQTTYIDKNGKNGKNGKNTKEKTHKKEKSTDSFYDADFKDFCNRYPFHKMNNMGAVRVEFDRLLKKGVDYADIRDGVERYAGKIKRCNDGLEFTKDAYGFLREGYWTKKWDHRPQPNKQRTANETAVENMLAATFEAAVEQQRKNER